jgi:hypothetical protein
MGINYVNDNIGKRCEVCKKGVIYYAHQKNGNKEVEVIGCANPDCKGYVEGVNIL